MLFGPHLLSVESLLENVSFKFVNLVTAKLISKSYLRYLSYILNYCYSNIEFVLYPIF